MLGACCTKHVQPSAFEITVTGLNATKAKIIIEPTNPDAYYCFGLVSRDMDEYFNMSDGELAVFQRDFCVEMWGYTQEDGTASSFADNFCYRGRLEYDYQYLDPDMDHKLVVYQIDPDSKQIIGAPCSKTFRTKTLVKTDITFTFAFETDKMTITPSNDAPYYWDYIITEEMLEEYPDAGHYYRELVFMYESYGFMEFATDTGVVEWVFSRDDIEPMEEGKKYTLVASGYNDGEINSDLTVIEFIYHRDAPCQLLTPQG